MAIQENEIFGRKKRIPRSVGRVKSQAIDTFVELAPGDYVVHVNYGIGLFRGIERIRAAGHERDYISLEYAGEEKVFVPIEQVNLVQRYIGQDGGVLRLDKLGGKSWENRKNRVKRSVEDLAERLVRLYSRRRTAKGFAFPADTDWQAEFEAGFPCQETEDQLRAIEDVKHDMESPQPMDRLVCGDVGLREDGGGPARRLQGGDGRQAGGDARAHHHPGRAALRDLPGAVPELPGAHGHAVPLRAPPGAEEGDRAG